MKNILLLEDDPILTMTFINLLSKYGRVQHYAKIDDALESLSSNDYDISFIDLYNSKTDITPRGLELLKLTVSKNIPSYILSSSEDSQDIDSSYQIGAKGYISKNHQFAEIQKNLNYCFIKLNSQKIQKLFFNEYVTSSQSLKNTIIQLLQTPEVFELNLHLQGETGVGKTLLVKKLVKQLFPNKKFFNLNLAEISDNLFESELFGHCKGSFTGATENKEGILKQANGHVLFLDEIAVLPPHFQNKLLKVIEDKKFSPVGSSREFKTDFTLVTASSENCLELIKNGKMKRDFYFRINGFEIEIPPLRNRKDDIRPLVEYFLRSRSKRIKLSEQQYELILERQWLGNIRELKNYINRVITLYPLNICLHNETQSELNLFDLTAKARKLGLTHILSQIEKSIFSEVSQKLENRVNLICRELKISKAVYYRLKESTSC